MRAFAHLLVNLNYLWQDVEAAFTAFHWTDAHIEPLFDKDQVRFSFCFVCRFV